MTGDDERERSRMIVGKTVEAREKLYEKFKGQELDSGCISVGFLCATIHLKI